MKTKGKISVAFDGQEKPAVTEKEVDFRTEVAPTIEFKFADGTDGTDGDGTKAELTLTVDSKVTDTDTQKVKAGEYAIKVGDNGDAKALVTIEVAEEDTAETIAGKVLEALKEDEVKLDGWNLSGAEVKKDSDVVTIVIEAKEAGTATTNPNLEFVASEEDGE